MGWRPQGATPQQVGMLGAALTGWAQAIRAATGYDVGAAQGAGASGGLGAGLIAFAGVTLHPRFDIVMQYLDFDRLIGQADLVITAEGQLDGQSPYGKVPCEVARRAAARSVPTIVLAGSLGKGVNQTFEHGVAAFASIIKRPARWRMPSPTATSCCATRLRTPCAWSRSALRLGDGQRLGDRQRALAA